MLDADMTRSPRFTNARMTGAASAERILASEGVEWSSNLHFGVY